MDIICRLINKLDYYAVCVTRDIAGIYGTFFLFTFDDILFLRIQDTHNINANNVKTNASGIHFYSLLSMRYFFVSKIHIVPINANSVQIMCKYCYIVKILLYYVQTYYII